MHSKCLIRPFLSLQASQKTDQYHIMINRNIYLIDPSALNNLKSFSVLYHTVDFLLNKLFNNLVNSFPVSIDFLCYDRDHHTTRSTPRRPKIQKDRFIRIHYFVLEIIFIDINFSHFIILPIISLWFYYNLNFISFL